MKSFLIFIHIIMIPSFVLCMDQLTMEKKITSLDKNNIMLCYKKTLKKIESFCPENPKSITDMIKILGYVNALKNVFTPEKLSLFAFNQRNNSFFPSLYLNFSTEIFPFFGKISFKKDTSVYNGACYISIIFKRIAEYNQYISLKNLKTPEPDEFKEYWECFLTKNLIKDAENKSICSINIETIEKCIRLNAMISSSIAYQEFNDLLHSIYTLRKEKPHYVEKLASIFYENNTSCSDAH